MTFVLKKHKVSKLLYKTFHNVFPTTIQTEIYLI